MPFPTQSLKSEPLLFAFDDFVEEISPSGGPITEDSCSTLSSHLRHEPVSQSPGSSSTHEADAGDGNYAVGIGSKPINIPIPRELFNGFRLPTNLKPLAFVMGSASTPNIVLSPMLNCAFFRPATVTSPKTSSESLRGPLDRILEVDISNLDRAMATYKWVMDTDFGESPALECDNGSKKTTIFSWQSVKKVGSAIRRLFMWEE